MYTFIHVKQILQISEERYFQSDKKQQNKTLQVNS